MRAGRNHSSREGVLQRLVSSRRICDRKWILSEADATGLKQGRAVSRTVGLEHQCPLTADPYSPIPAVHFLDTDRTKSIHRSPLYKSMRRAQLPFYRPQDPFRRYDGKLLPELERFNLMFGNPQKFRQCRA